VTRAVTIALAAVIAGSAVVFWLIPEAPAGALRQQLERAARAIKHPGGMSGPALGRELASVLEGDAVIRGDVPTVGRGPAGVVAWVARARAEHARVELAFTNIAVRGDATSSTVTAQADAALTLAKRSGEVHQETRQLTLRLVRDATHLWKIAAVDVAPRTHAEPEARP
jgi:hypothetical protein